MGIPNERLMNRKEINFIINIIIYVSHEKYRDLIQLIIDAIAEHLMWT